MTALRSPARGKRKRAAQPYGGDRAAVARLAGMFRSFNATRSRNAVQILDGRGEQVELPASLAEVIARAASLMAEGHSVSVIADDEVLTTQEAAERLNVSRQYIVRLIDRGEIPAMKVGTHRRVRAIDIDAFRKERDARRDVDLDRLSTLSEDIGGYQFTR